MAIKKLGISERKLKNNWQLLERVAKARRQGKILISQRLCFYAEGARDPQSYFFAALRKELSGYQKELFEEREEKDLISFVKNYLFSEKGGGYLERDHTTSVIYYIQKQGGIKRLHELVEQKKGGLRWEDCTYWRNYFIDKIKSNEPILLEETGTSPSKETTPVLKETTIPVVLPEPQKPEEEKNPLAFDAAMNFLKLYFSDEEELLSVTRLVVSRGGSSYLSAVLQKCKGQTTDKDFGNLVRGLIQKDLLQEKTTPLIQEEQTMTPQEATPVAVTTPLIQEKKPKRKSTKTSLKKEEPSIIPTTVAVPPTKSLPVRIEKQETIETKEILPLPLVLVKPEEKKISRMKQFFRIFNIFRLFKKKK